MKVLHEVLGDVTPKMLRGSFGRRSEEDHLSYALPGSFKTASLSRESLSKCY